ncbi:hypothetical protein PS15p_200330 [Mucor circinelloides]
MFSVFSHFPFFFFFFFLFPSITTTTTTAITFPCPAMALHYIIGFLILLKVIVNYLKHHTQLLSVEKKTTKQQPEQDDNTTSKLLRDTSHLGGTTSKYMSTLGAMI